MMAGAFFLLNIGCAAPAFAPPQNENDPYRMVKVRHGGYTRRPDFNDAIQNRQFRGIRTRVDVLRDMDELTKRAADRYRNRLPDSALRGYLKKRNLLTARSPLGIKLTSDLGLRTIEMPEEEGFYSDLFTDVSPSEPVQPATNLDEPIKKLTYEDVLEARVKVMADEYYEKGLFYTSSYDPLNRKKNTMLQARSNFGLCIDAEPDKPRGYLANAIVSFYNSEPRQAYRYLIEGLKRVKTADDLRIDKERFLSDVDDFRTMYDKASVFARNLDADQESAGNLMLAFFAHIYGDHALAVTSIDLAAKNPPADIGEDVFRIQELIRNSPPTTSSPNEGK